MESQILIRGQSNAVFFGESGNGAAAGRLASEVQRLLGFDGMADSVKILFAKGEEGEQRGTARSGTAFLGEWMRPGPDGAWQPTSLESGLLRSASELGNPAASATAVLWLHSESDSRRADLAVGEWMAAVRQDAALLRGALGGDAASVPYHFVSAHPYVDGTPQGHQAIRMGMEALAADPAFHARIAARALDIDASLDDRDGDPRTVEHGGQHITPGDALLIADRAARAIAEDWSDYARPGSPVFLAGGDIADVGPRVLSAERTGPDSLRLLVAQDQGGGFAPLDPEAARGIGWGVSGTAAPPVAARSAVVQGPNTMDLFSAGPRQRHLRRGGAADLDPGRGHRDRRPAGADRRPLAEVGRAPGRAPAPPRGGARRPHESPRGFVVSRRPPLPRPPGTKGRRAAEQVDQTGSTTKMILPVATTDGQRPGHGGEAALQPREAGVLGRREEQDDKRALLQGGSEEPP